MSFNAYIVNAEVMKNVPTETKIGTISKITAKTWNKGKKGAKPLEVIFQATVFNPTSDVLALANGDKIHIGAPDNTVPVKIDSNPNVVQVRSDQLGTNNPKTYPSRFVELTCNGEQVTLVEKKDKTRKPTNERAMPANSSTDFDDDLLF